MRALLVVVVLALACNTLAARPSLPLGTSGRWIVDSKGKRVKLACANWYGAEEKDYVVGGLDRQSLQFIAKSIASMGFNCVRLPWSLEMQQLNPTVSPKLLKANPALVGKKAMEVYDEVVTALVKEDVMVLLDNHMSKADWCCTGDDGNGLWYTDGWPESSWIDGWKQIVARYRNESMVIDAELRNEPRQTVVNGKTKKPTWGGKADTDWRAAAERGAQAVKSVNPNLLIVVEALDYGQYLNGVEKKPLTFDRLVYAAHDYSYFNGDCKSYEELHEKLGRNWAFVIRQNTSYTAPVMVTEFGTCHGDKGCYRGWFEWFIRFLGEGGDFDWAYWAIDGTQSTGTGRNWGQEESYGIFNTQWSAPASAEHLAYVQSIMKCRENC